MEDLHIALQNINTSTFPPVDIIPSANQFQSDIHRILESQQAEMQLSDEAQVEDDLEVVHANEGHEIIGEIIKRKKNNLHNCAKCTF